MLTGEPTLFQYRQGGCDITCIVTGNKWKQNTYIVTQASSVNTVIVDPGDCGELIIGQIEGAGAKVRRILLTHPHHDHVGAAQLVSEHFGIACELHTDDVRLLMHAPMYALSFAKKKITAVSNFRPLAELAPVGEEPAMRALHTPGHTKGSVCYLFDGFVFTGDTLLYEHVGRTDLPGASAEDIARSIGRLLDAACDETTIFPGHGRPWTIGAAKRWWRETGASPARYDNFSKL